MCNYYLKMKKRFTNKSRKRRWIKTFECVWLVYLSVDEGGCDQSELSALTNQHNQRASGNFETKKLFIFFPEFTRKHSHGHMNEWRDNKLSCKRIMKIKMSSSSSQVRWAQLKIHRDTLYACIGQNETNRKWKCTTSNGNSDSFHGNIEVFCILFMFMFHVSAGTVCLCECVHKNEKLNLLKNLCRISVCKNDFSKSVSSNCVDCRVLVWLLPSQFADWRCERNCRQYEMSWFVWTLRLHWILLWRRMYLRLQRRRQR